MSKQIFTRPWKDILRFIKYAHKVLQIVVFNPLEILIKTRFLKSKVDSKISFKSAHFNIGELPLMTSDFRVGRGVQMTQKIGRFRVENGR